MFRNWFYGFSSWKIFTSFYITIPSSNSGLNISVMTREGNRIISEYSLLDSEWIKILEKIILHYNMKEQKIDSKGKSFF